MNDNPHKTPRTKAELREANEQLRARLDEAEQTLDAIRSGNVDALVVAGPQGDLVFSLTGAERTYRLIVETMHEAALTVDLAGTILFCNKRFAALVKSPMAAIIGHPLTDFVAFAHKPQLQELLANAQESPTQQSLTLRASDGFAVSVHVGANLLVEADCTSIGLVASDLTELVALTDSIGALREHQRALEESKIQLQSACADLHQSRQAALSVSQEAITAQEQAEALASQLFKEISERLQAEQALKESESLFRALFENSLDAVLLTIPDGGSILSANPAACAMFGMAEEEIIRVGLAGLNDPDDPRLAAAKEERKRTGQLRGVGLDFICKNGRRFPAEVDSVILPGDPQRAFVIICDITERKQAEETLKKVNDGLETLVLKRTQDLAKNIEKLKYEIVDRQKAEERVQRLNRLYAVLSATSQVIIRIKDKETLFNDFCRIAVEKGNFKLAWIGLVDQESKKVEVGASAGASSYLEDIKITLNESTGRGPTGIALRDGSYYICNDFLAAGITKPWHERARTHGIRASASIALKQQKQVIGALTLYAEYKDFFDSQHVELLQQMGDDLSFALDNITRETERQEAEQALRKETAERMRAEADVRILNVELEQRVLERTTQLQLEIAVRQQAEEQIKASLAEKEVMLREIHHRVKNNLQVISSLINLQAAGLTDQAMRHQFTDVRDRIRSMAMIHEKLYQTSNLARLNFADYAASLLSSLWRSHGSLVEKLRLKLEIAPVVLSIETAVPCGLILNELAGNALKHGFPNGRCGEVTVQMDHYPSTNTVCLRVHDTGVGLPTCLDWQQSSSLGLRLVQILTNQLRGSVETGTGPGTEIKITFPLNRFPS